MEGPISFWGYKEQESILILPEHDDDDEKTKFFVTEEGLTKDNINVQGEHKVFLWLQTFIARKLRGIQTYFFFKCNSHDIKF